MREFLNQTFHEKASVNQFVDSLTHDPGGPGSDLPPALQLFANQPAQVTRDIFTFIATAPRELSEKVGELLDEAKGVMLSEEERAELTALSTSVREMGELMDKFTRYIAMGKPWTPIYNGPVKVTRVWRTKRNEEIVGEPEDRVLPIDQVPNRLTSLVLVQEETNKGMRTRPMMCVSDGQYREDASIGPVREDFLIDLPAMFEHGASVSPRGRINRGCSPQQTCQIFATMMNGSLDLLEAILVVAKPLVQRGLIEDDIWDFAEKVFASKPLKPEDNPDAKYEIGGWS